jgi:crotonobetainyl-CoA:carnitine CoA-transferase CaiB-like acyl-CoA transferase
MADMTSGLYTCNAIMFALYHRDLNGGPGQVIDVSLFESLFSVLGPLAAEYAALGTERTREGSRSRNAGPRGCYQTSDHRWIAVSGSTPKMAERFLRGYGLGAMLEDPRFATNEARVAHAELLDAAIRDAIARRTLADNMAIIERNDLTAVVVQTVKDIEQDPHWQERQLTVTVEGADGAVTMHNVFPRLSETPGAIEQPGGEMGRDNESVYREFGLEPSDLARLAKIGAI